MIGKVNIMAQAHVLREEAPSGPVLGGKGQEIERQSPRVLGQGKGQKANYDGQKGLLGIQGKDAQGVSKDELDTFIDSMTQLQLEKVSGFFDDIPKVYKDIEVTNPNTKVKSKVRLEGMETFF